MGCWTSSCHMESPWLSHSLSSGEIRCAPISGPLAPSLVCSQWPMKAQEPGLASQHDGKRELESLGPEAHTFPAEHTTSTRIPCSALCLLPRELLDLKPCPTVVWLPPSCSPYSPPPFPLLLLLSSSSSLPPCSMPTPLMLTTFLPPGLQQQLVTCGAPHPVWGLCQGCQGCTLHQEEWGTPTDH